MATFKDVISKLEENKGDNRQAFTEQTKALSTAFSDVIKTQNRSFGQSLSLQNNKLISPLNNIVTSLQDLSKAFSMDAKVDKELIGPLPEGQEENVNSLSSIYDVLVSINTNLMEQFNTEQSRLDEKERQDALEKAKGAGAGSGSVTPGADGKDKKGGGLLSKVGALGAAAMASAKGIASMGLAISAFFGGLVLGNKGLELAQGAGFDFDMKATKDAAKGFSGIISELTPEAMIAIGALIAGSAVAAKGGGKPVDMAKGVAAMGLAITAFFGGLIVGDTILGVAGALGADMDFTATKKVIAGFDSIISDMSTESRVVIGALLVAGSANAITGKGKAMDAAFGVAAMGLGISAFFGGLLVGDTLMGVAGALGADLDMAATKKVVAGFTDVVGELDTASMTALGAIFGLSFLTSYSSKAKASEVAFGMAAIGAGIGGFFVGLALGDAALGFLGTDYSNIGTAVKNFGEAIGSLDEKALIALGALLGAGGLIGALGGTGGAAKVAAGMTAVGAGIGGFLLALGGADFLAGFTGDGSNIKTLVTNFGDAISSLDTTALIALGALLAAGAVFGAAGGASAAVGMTLIGAGIAGFFLAFEGLAAFGAIFGLDGSNVKKLIGNMSDGLKSLDGLDGANLKKVSGALLALGPAIVGLLGAEGLGKVASFVTDTLKGAWNWLTGNDDEGEKEQTIIDQLVELIKPVEELNSVDLDAFLDTTNALTQFLQNDYMKGGDEFEYFVNKLMTNVPKLEGALFGDGDIEGLANNANGYIQASKNIRMLKGALGETMDENADMRMGGNLSGGNSTIVTTADNNSTSNVTNNRSVVSVNSSASNNERTIEAMNMANGSQYDLQVGEL